MVTPVPTWIPLSLTSNFVVPDVSLNSKFPLSCSITLLLLVLSLRYRVEPIVIALALAADEYAIFNLDATPSPPNFTIVSSGKWTVLENVEIPVTLKFLPTLTSLFAVIIPTESIFVTSSYVNVPPMDTLPSTLKEPNVPTVVILDEPPKVLNAVFSTLPKPTSPLTKLKSDFNSVAVLPSRPLAVNLAYSSSATSELSILTALVSEIPNVKASCLAFHVVAEAI